MKFFDLHCDTPYRCYKENLPFCDDRLDVTMRKAMEFDEWHQCFAVFINDGIQNPYEYYRNVLDNFKCQLTDMSENMTPIFTVEGGLLIEDDLSRVESMHNDGIRALTLTWNGENQIAGGVNSEAGLKDFGKNVINRLNDFNILTDLSHLNKKSFYDALEIAKFPVVTHACLDFVNNHHRNLDDNQLKLLIQKRGIFGLCFYPVFLGEGDVFENVYKNIYHILDMGYEDFLSIGSDFDGAQMDNKLHDISFVPTLYKFLKSKKIDKTILDKIFFYNAYNFFNGVKLQ